MCDYCTYDTRQKAQEDDRDFAARLKKLAQRYSDIADGRILPHTEENKSFGPLAANIIRRLVEDWV